MFECWCLHTVVTAPLTGSSGGGGTINRPPKGGLAAPLWGLSQLTAPAPSGAGEEAEGRAGSGGCTALCQNSDTIIERVDTSFVCQNSDKARVLLARAGAAILYGFGHLSKSV